MTIGIDIRVLGNPTKSGIEEYTENLLSRLLPLDKNIKFKLFFSSARNILPDYEWLHLPNVELHNFKIPNRLLFAGSRIGLAPSLDKMIGGADVFFFPHFFLASLSSDCRRVTTFHDLSFLHFPEFFSWRGNLWHKLEMTPRWQSKFSDSLITVSESTKKDLIDSYDIDPAKIEVIHSGISPDIKKPDKKVLQDFKTKNNLPDKFILFLGKLEPRKNISGLIRAFNGIKENDREDIHLVIVGSRGWLYGDIFKEINRSPFKNKIIIKNHIPDKERSFYYSLASVFIYPSFFEGFGFPPLEAMACGTPVIVSNRSSLPEVVEKAGLLINPNSVNEIILATESVLKDQKLKDELARRGIAKSGYFNWDKTAQKTLRYILK